MLGLLDGVFQRQLTPPLGRQLPVAQEAEGLGPDGKRLQQLASLGQPAGVQHRIHPRLNPLVERLPVGPQAQLGHGIPEQGVAPGAEELAARPPCQEADLQRPHQFGRVARGDGLRRLCIHPRQQPVQMLAAPLLRQQAQAHPQLLRARRQGREPLQQRP